MTRTPISASFCRRLAVWLLVSASLLSALAPAVSHAIGAERGFTGGMEICTDQGPKLVSTASSSATTDSPGGSDSVTSRAHCLLCLSATDFGAPPPQPLPYLLRVLTGAQVAAVWQTVAPFTHFAFAPPPRGPPSLF